MTKPIESFFDFP